MIVFGGWGSIAGMLGAAGILSAMGERIGPLAAGVALLAFGQWLHNWDVHPQLDPSTGQMAIYRKRHHMFWIPMRWWGLALAVSGVFALAGG